MSEKGTIIERDWVTASGFRAICLVCVRHDGSKSHRCGYVGVPKGHPLHGVEYSDRLKELEPHTSPDTDATVPSEATPECVFEVHGGLTYSSSHRPHLEGEISDDYPADGDEWWLGFDCLHAGDKEIEPWVDPEIRKLTSIFREDGVVRSQEYVEEECEQLAQQIVSIFPKEPVT